MSSIAGHCQVLGIVVHVIAQLSVGAACLQLHVVATGAAGGRGSGTQLSGRDLNAGLGQQARGEIRIEGAGHRQHGQVLGRDATVLARHVRVERVPRLGHGTAQHAPVAGTDGVLVLEMGAQGVGRTVDLAALGAGSGVSGSHANLERSS